MEVNMGLNRRILHLSVLFIVLDLPARLVSVRRGHYEVGAVLRLDLDHFYFSRCHYLQLEDALGDGQFLLVLLLLLPLMMLMLGCFNFNETKVGLQVLTFSEELLDPRLVLHVRLVVPVGSLPESRLLGQDEELSIVDAQQIIEVPDLEPQLHVLVVVLTDSFSYLLFLREHYQLLELVLVLLNPLVRLHTLLDLVLGQLAPDYLDRLQSVFSG
mmetsp:Transcript_15642/g.23982  ORF Transcript_15642/g.23982 Transcript_15642/m.23982 type:complete len:214 (-) Transcript_15642:3739-4380(-)